jgi:hypothetical protein
MRFPIVNLGAAFTRQTQFALVDEAAPPPVPAAAPPPQQSAIPFSPETASQTMQNPPSPSRPFPRFITEDEATKKRNVLGLAVTGGIMAAAIAAGMLIFR